MMLIINSANMANYYTLNIDYEAIQNKIGYVVNKDNVTATVNIEIELECPNKHKFKVNKFDTVTCTTCEREAQKAEQMKEVMEIVEKINKAEDIDLDEFKYLVAALGLDFQYHQDHKCHKCASYKKHVHYNGYCFCRTKDQDIRYGFDTEETDWEMNPIELIEFDDDVEVYGDEIKYQCGRGDYDVYAEDLVEAIKERLG